MFTIAVSHAPAPSQHPFGSVTDLSSRLCFPAAFRRLAFASWGISSPPPNWASLAVGLLAGPDDDGVITFRTNELQAGRVPFLLRGRGVLPRHVLDALALAHHRRLCQPSVLRRPVFTEPRQRFIRIHPSALSLARLFSMVKMHLRASGKNERECRKNSHFAHSFPTLLGFTPGSAPHRCQ